jgi:hypothetical protein
LISIVREAFSTFVFRGNNVAAMAAVARWFAGLEDGVAVDGAVLGLWDLSVSHFGGTWRWRVEREGDEAAGGAARTPRDAREQAEGMALLLTAGYLG